MLWWVASSSVQYDSYDERVKHVLVGGTWISTFRGRERWFPEGGTSCQVLPRERKIDDKGKPYTQKAFAKVLGISEIALREIENRDAGMDFERRQFLCKLFNIPPILLGVVTLEQVNKILEEKGITLSTL